MVVQDSSAISDIVYREQTGDLFVFFVDGTSYIYDGVPQSVADAFMSADSKGRYFNKFIRPYFHSKTMKA